MENKISTSVEQSRKLLKLGLKPETADMWYNIDICDKFGIDSYCMWPSLELTSALDIPAWSLSALLSLMPYTIELCKESPTYVLGIYRTSDGYAIDYWNSMNGNRAALYKGSGLLDVAVEMIEWLLENKYINN